MYEVMVMDSPVYKRVLLKISGEALAGEKHSGLDFGVIGSVCEAVKKCVDMGVEVGVVIGGGNFWRGVKDGEGKIERTRADHMGMLATVMNCLAVADVMEQHGVDVRVQTAIEMRSIAEPYIRLRAMRHLAKGRVVLFACGTGSPYFSTDTAAVLRAARSAKDYGEGGEPRTSTASIPRTRSWITAPSNTTPSAMTRSWPSTWPSWIRRRRACPWITTSL